MSVRLRLGSSNAALEASFDPLVARVLAHRGISHPAQVNYQLKQLLPYHQLKMSAILCLIGSILAMGSVRPWWIMQKPVSPI